jgi:ribonuclease-3
VSDYARLESALGRSFARRELLEEALTHRSYLNEHAQPGRGHNERLEFLGDAILGAVTAHLLMTRFPDVREGDLSMLRAQLVSELQLASIARGLGLGEWLFLGRGEEQTGGRAKPSLLADAFEALVGAMFLDAGFAEAAALIERCLAPALAQLAEPGAGDHKTRLQHLVQARLRETPKYTLLGSEGPDHGKTFEVAVLAGGRELARGTGRSKKEAEQRAAEAALAAWQET